MKICLISGHPKNWDAGASTVYLHLDQDLRRRGQECTLYHAGDYSQSQMPASVQKLAAAQAITRKLGVFAAEADVVEVAGNLGWHLFRNLLSKGNAKRPLLVTRLHGLEFKDEQARIEEEIAQTIKLPRKYKLLTRHWINWQEFRSLALADVVICHSSRDADAIVTAKLKPESAVHIMPLGVDESYLTERSYQDAGNRLLWWGSWIERKGISALPGAFEKACRCLPDLTLTIGGSGLPPDAILESFSPQIRSRITVLPFVPRQEHVRILQQHDIFLFPSLSEGFGFALLEAMATGLPCITTFTGLAHDWLEHGKNSYLVPMSAPTALARAIERLSEDTHLRCTLGTGGQRTARTLTWDRLGELTERAYSQSIEKRGQRG